MEEDLGRRPPTTRAHLEALGRVERQEEAEVCEVSARVSINGGVSGEVLWLLIKLIDNLGIVALDEQESEAGVQAGQWKAIYNGAAGDWTGAVVLFGLNADQLEELQAQLQKKTITLGVGNLTITVAHDQGMAKEAKQRGGPTRGAPPSPGVPMKGAAAEEGGGAVPMGGGPPASSEARIHVEPVGVAGLKVSLVYAGGFSPQVGSGSGSPPLLNSSNEGGRKRKARDGTWDGRRGRDKKSSKDVRGSHFGSDKGGEDEISLRQLGEQQLIDEENMEWEREEEERDCIRRRRAAQDGGGRKDTAEEEAGGSAGSQGSARKEPTGQKAADPAPKVNMLGERIMRDGQFAGDYRGVVWNAQTLFWGMMISTSKSTDRF